MARRGGSIRERAEALGMTEEEAMDAMADEAQDMLPAVRELTSEIERQVKQKQADFVRAEIRKATDEALELLVFVFGGKSGCVCNGCKAIASLRKARGE